MGVLSDFFIADRSPVPNYNGGDTVSALDKCQFKAITPLQAAQFLAVLRGKDYSVDMVREFRLVTPEDAEEWTMSVPDDMAGKLAALNTDQIPELAAKFSIATGEELGWSPGDFVPVVNELVALARRAKETGKVMYLWNSL
jgi:hypothetical protein